jgi:predicted MarR family transcription regulator
MSPPGNTRRGARGLDKHWHLATDEFEVEVTELEFSIFRVSAAFERWQADCLGCCHGQPFSGTDTALLHVIRMHDRPKGISELARLLKRDDLSNLQYGVRKLLKAGLIEKSRQTGTSKKDVTYQVSALGRDVTDKYARFRKELLISMTRATAGNVDFESLARALTMMSAMYDQASCVAATHRLPL